MDTQTGTAQHRRELHDAADGHANDFRTHRSTPQAVEADAEPVDVDQLAFWTQPSSEPESTATSSPDDAPEADADPAQRKSTLSKLLPPFLTKSREKKPKTPAQPGEVKDLKRPVGQDRAARKRPVPRSVRAVLGYKAMLPSGIAWLGEDEWSITLRLSDINYVAAEEDTQTGIIDQWGKFINSFGGGTRLQISVVNRVLDDEDVTALVHKPLRDDALDPWREDFNIIARELLAAQSSNTITSKYLTITVQEPDVETAQATLTRVANETVAALRGMDDCEAEILTRAERLTVLGHMLRPHQVLNFSERDFNEQPEHGAFKTHDVIAPWSIKATVKDGPIVLTSGGVDTHHTSLWVRDFPAYLSDRLISELADIKANVNVSLHLEPYDQADGTRLINRQIAELEMQKVEARKRATKQNLDPDEDIPNSLKVALDETQGLRRELQQSNQKVLSSVLLIGISAASADELTQAVKRAQTVIRKQSCIAEVCSYMQQDALTTTLPLGLRPIPMRRTLTTGSAAIIVPFTTQECFHPGGNLYGLNGQSGNAVVVDRTRGINANGFILGSSGSGKGVAAKNEIMNVLTSRPDDDVIIIDPEHEYEPLVHAFSGSIVRVDATSSARLNPLEIDLEDDLAGDPITQKCVDVLDMLSSLIGGRHGLDDSQRGILDRSLRRIYNEYSEGGSEQPTLRDLRNVLLADTSNPLALALADSLEIYTEGSLSAFAQQTNVDVKTRLVCWDISLLSSSLMTFGMMVILDQIWKRIARNRREGRRTWVYVDEFHLMFADSYSTQYFLKIWKRARKWGGVPTGITQNVEELRDNPHAGLMLANSDFLLLLRQHADDADALRDLLNLSQQQRNYFTNVPPGSGLIKAGNTIIPLKGQIPTDSELFKLYNTSFGG